MKEITYRNIMEKIKVSYGTFPPQQQKIANFILTHYPKIAFLTATQLGEAVGVSQPTVVRFCQFLGFSGYSEFTEILQKRVRHELTTTERFSLSLSETEKTLMYPQRILFQEIRKLRELAENFPVKIFNEAVYEIIKSEKIFVIGMRGSASLAQYFSYFLRKVKRPVYNLSHGGTVEYDIIMEMTPNDLAVVIAFPRYPRETIEISKLIKDKGGKILAITDNSESPLFPLASKVLLTPISFTTLFDSYSAPLCLLNMLVTEVGRKDSETSQKLLEDYEAMAQKTGVFYKAPGVKNHEDIKQKNDEKKGF